MLEVVQNGCGDVDREEKRERKGRQERGGEQRRSYSRHYGYWSTQYQTLSNIIMFATVASIFIQVELAQVN